jgi:hypothetical protein
VGEAGVRIAHSGPGGRNFGKGSAKKVRVTVNVHLPCFSVIRSERRFGIGRSKSLRLYRRSRGKSSNICLI